MKARAYSQRLVAILFADVVGYSRLTGEDEIRTDRIVNEYFQLISKIAVSHNGRVVQIAGDSLLSEFTTATNALACGLDVLEQLAIKNEKHAESKQVQFRIGINLGEVNCDEDRIFGDSINIAARLESLAEPGGICVSEGVRTAVGNKISVDYEFLGEQYVKNISEPIRPYHVFDRASTRKSEKAQRLSIRRNLTPAVVVAALAVFIAGGVLSINLWDRFFARDTAKAIEISRPSIAVLPFDNLGDDKEQDQFSDGLTNDVITDLSKFSGLFVIAANSTFHYKNKPTKIQVVAKELNVRYVLEGSVQRIDDNLRINAQLIEAENGHHIWAEKYDRKTDDFFIIQNDIAEKIVAAIGPISGAQGTLRKSELTRMQQIPTVNLSAYEHYLKGIVHYEKFNSGDNLIAREQFSKAIELDPGYSQALARMAWTYIQESWSGWSEDSETSINQAKILALRAIDADAHEAEAYKSYGSVLLFSRQHEGAVRNLRKALELNPNNADNIMYLGWVMTYSGQPEEGLAMMSEALLRNPFYPGWYYWDLAWGSFVLRDYEDAIRTLEKREPKSNFTHLLLAVNYQKVGRENEAINSMKIFRELEPRYSVASAAKQEPFKYKEDLTHYLDALRRVGLPEQ
ncbi:MAG: adenylate/guanylate cyclase domain-containing protein [Granulosicoccus sp.]